MAGASRELVSRSVNEISRSSARATSVRRSRVLPLSIEPKSLSVSHLSPKSRPEKKEKKKNPSTRIRHHRIIDTPGVPITGKGQKSNVPRIFSQLLFKDKIQQPALRLVSAGTEKGGRIVIYLNQDPSTFPPVFAPMHKSYLKRKRKKKKEKFVHTFDKPFYSVKYFAAYNSFLNFIQQWTFNNKLPNNPTAAGDDKFSI